MADKERREGGKSPTKFMERPGSKKPEKTEEEIRKDKRGAEFIEDDLDALERQETYDEEESRRAQEVSRPGHKGDEKPDPRKFQDPATLDRPAGDEGDSAC